MSYGSDDEQVEALRRWWSENGRSVIAGVVIAVVALGGYHQWNSYRAERAEAASNDYLVFLEQIQADDAGEGAVRRGEALIDDYGSTPYGPLTALWLAQHHVGEGQLDAAADALRWAVDEADTEALRQVARVRLARILLAQEKYEEVLALLPAQAGAFEGEYAELRGDALVGQGQLEAAAGAYRDALAADSLAPQSRQLIELKLNDLGVSAEPVS